MLITIMIIPVIYSCVFLGSMWDPYGNTDQIPVTVVYLDKAVMYEDKYLQIGNELTEKLLENTALNFIETNAEDAMTGLENGDYYMIITIPTNFSEHATTLLSDEPEKMILQYTTNPGTNYIASKIDESAITKIQTEVADTVTKTYAEVLFFSVQTVGDGLQEAANGSKQLEDGGQQLLEGNQTISDNLTKLANSSFTFQNGAITLESGLIAYTDGVAQAYAGTQ